MIDKICSGNLAATSPELKRTLHTLKGNTALMGLGLVAKLCHSLEDHIENTGELSPQLLQQLEQRWKVIRSHISSLAGEDGQRVVEIPADQYSLMLAEFAQSADHALMHQLMKWQLDPVARYFERLAEQSRALAVRLGKGDIQVQTDAGGLRVDGERWRPLFAELVHVVRNAIDHGLESPEERQASGKPIRGTLTLKACMNNGRLVFEIKDDGRGIAWDAIRERAAAYGLPHATHQDLVNALCHDGLSTKSSATQESGRGVGLPALKNRARSMQGLVDVHSNKGQGTTVTITFPLAAQGDVLVDPPPLGKPALAGSVRGAGVA